MSSPELVASPPFASTEQPVENDAFDRVSIDWVPSDDSSSPLASPVAVASLEARSEESGNAQPAAPAPENAGYLERYQRLFASDVVDPERAILAALDAAIQAPASEVPRDEPDALTAPLVLPSSAPVAGFEPAPAVSASAPVALSEPEPAAWVVPVELRAPEPSPAPEPSAAPELAVEPSSAIAPAATEALVAAAPAVAAVVASSVSAPAARSEPPPASNSPSSPPDAAPASQAPPKLDVKRDVDWSEDVLARAARAAAAAGERARAQQQAQAAAAGLGSQRPGPASPGRTFAEAPAADRARAESSSRARPSEAVEAVPSERAARNKARRQHARRARFAATPLFLFAFVGSVMVSLGVGFVSGFVVGRETPKAQPASVAPPAPQPAALVAEPAAPAPEAQPTARRKGALTSRVEAIVPATTPSGQPLAAGGPETASAASSAAAKLVRGPFDPKSAGAALSKAASRAGICVPPGDAGGEAVVTITLDPSGVTSNAAVYGARFSGTQAGECIAGLLREVKVRPFAGEPVTVKKTIQVN